MLKCNKCEQLLPTTDFYYTGLGKRKYQYSCKQCSIQRIKDTYNNKRKPKWKNREDTKYSCTKDNIPRIYFFYSGSEVVYIGLSTSFAFRLSRHKVKSGFFKHVTSIQVATLESEIEMAVYESILINHYQPKYNKHIYKGESPFPLPNLTFEDWPLP